MTETPGSYAGETIPQPSHRFTRAEQLKLLLWHPLFTGRCPQCGQTIAQADTFVQWWHCGACGAGRSATALAKPLTDPNDPR